MARYTSLFRVSVSLDRFRQLLTDILRSCCLDVIYASEDYLVAREVPGHVTYTKLVTVEVMIDQSLAEAAEVQLSFIVKNEELPLQINNHCHQVFNLVNQAITENRQWRLITSIAS